jgi:hypothetical protein
MTLNRQAKQRLARKDRKARNVAGKELKAIQRQRNLVELGKTLVAHDETTEVDGKPVTTKVYDLPPTGPKNGRGRVKEPQQMRAYNNSASLVWIGGKTHPTQGMQHKTRPGEKELHLEAIGEDGGRTFAKEVAKAQSVPVPLDQIPELGVPIVPTIGAFADHDPAQGAAIDHSIATGEPLFAEPQQ